MSAARKTSSSRGSSEKENAALSLDYDYLSRLALKYWKGLTGAILLGAVGGYIYALNETPMYMATATINVQPKDDKEPGVPHPGEVDTSSADLLKTFEQLLQTTDLVRRVVKSQHLQDNPDFLPKGFTPPVSEETATDLLASEASISIRPMTRLIDIKVVHTSPKMTKLLADSLAHESIAQQFDQQTSTASVLSDDLQKEVDQLRKKVADSEQALNDYQVSHKENGQGVSFGDKDDLVGSNLKNLNQEYMNAQAQVTLLRERYGEQHPKLIEAEKLVTELGDEVRKAQDNSLALGSQSIGYNTLKSEAESSRQQLSSLLAALNETRVAVTLTNPGISVAQEARVPGAPFRPNKTKSMALGGMIGLVCGVGFIFGLYFTDSSVRTVSQAETTLSVPVIAAVPILTESDGRSVLPTYSDPQSFVAEAFRGLRASLLLHDRENPLRTILVCSAIPGEGKSFCAANIAVAFAQAGLKTLLIDADLRLPTLHTYFNIPANEETLGLKDVLSGRTDLASAAMSSPLPTLELLLTPTPADSPAELLSGIHLPLLLDEAASQYDRVVIDSAPLNAVSDTMLIMTKADAVLLVVRAAQTPSKESKAALQKISSSGKKTLGLILNYLAAHTLKSYAYGYSYGQKPKEKNAK